MGSITVKKESISELAAKAIEKYQTQFEAETGGRISKQTAIVKILESYFDTKDKEVKKI